ncbi:MAG TPA: RcnB family protein [Novosphingobium sp.]|nr:RcnB family protein [Novosphingobium sp.]
MRNALSIAIAAAILVPGVASAQPGWDRHDRGPGRHDDRGWHDRGGPDWHRGPPPGWRPGADWRQFRRGDRFDPYRAPNYAVIDYRRYHRLRPPPPGYHWVRSGGDALMVGIATGVVASVMIGAMR